MVTIFWVILIIVGWTILGSYILGYVDTKLELTKWKQSAPALLSWIITMLWPIVAILYFTKNHKIK